jgi:hypothetical protein
METFIFSPVLGLYLDLLGRIWVSPGSGSLAVHKMDLGVKLPIFRFLDGSTIIGT